MSSSILNLENFSLKAFGASFGLSRILPAVITLALCLLAIWLLTKLTDKLLGRSKKIDGTLGGFIRSAVRGVMWILTVIIVADALGIPTTSLVALVSVVGLALSLSVQNIMSNLFSGITLLITKPFVAGDFVDIAGKTGTIKSLGLFYTMMDTVDNTVINIPNGDVTAASIVNYSREALRRVDMKFCASYDDTTEKVKAAILEAAESEPIKWRTMLHLFLITGRRREDICGLKWSKIDFDTGIVCIDTALLYLPKLGIYESSTKTENVTYLPLPQETMQLLREYRAWYNELRLKNGDRWQDSGFLFVKNNGAPIHPDSFAGWLRRFTTRHDLPHLHPHGFRHTNASMLIGNGVDVVTVANRLGHADVSTTLDIYSHAISEAKAKASETLADVMLRRKKA